MKSLKEFHSPKVTLIFIFGVISILGLISFIFPEKGLKVGSKTFYFVSVNDIFSKNEEQIDVEALIQARKDSIEAYEQKLKDIHFKSLEDSILSAQELLSNDPTRLMYGNSSRDGLDQFFNALQNIKSSNRPIRILHFGDSQIEEDRITSYIRKRIQQEFGGNGVGLMPALGITRSRTFSHYPSENWVRYTSFGNGNKAQDGRYGASGIMCKFRHFVSDSIDSVLIEKSFSNGLISFTPRSKVSDNIKNYNRIKIFLGFNSKPVEVSISFDTTYMRKSIDSNTSLQIVNFDLPYSPSKVTVKFSGNSSPEVYGISFETPDGVHVDNISMRGASGTIFSGFNKSLAKNMFEELNPKLIILQYGGNVMPYIKSKEKADKYGKEFLRNLKVLKSMCPNTAFLVIGPSDMSTNINGKMQTYPNLPDVRNALKEAVFEIGGAYFDMYEVMGGHNSMPSWVNANPPLAAKDYIHFSFLGSEKIAEIFYESLMLDYEHYLQRQRKNQFGK